MEAVYASVAAAVVRFGLFSCCCSWRDCSCSCSGNGNHCRCTHCGSHNFASPLSLVASRPSTLLASLPHALALAVVFTAAVADTLALSRLSESKNGLAVTCAVELVPLLDCVCPVCASDCASASAQTCV